MARIKALTPSFGVEVTDLDGPLDDTLVTRCVEALAWRGVLLIRGLHLDDDAQVALSRKIGEVVSLAGRDIFPVSLDPAKNPAAEYLKGTFNWHIDGTSDDVPIKATTLTARHVATVGGGTEFANTYAAYDSLSEKDRKRYQDLRVVHSFEASQRRVNPNPSDEQATAWRRRRPNETPLVWKRRDGRCSLVLGGAADYIVGMDRDESRLLLDELLDWATQERFRYTHEWQVGDLVAWDNTGMLHRALPYDASSQRTLHRTTIIGDEALA